MRADEIQRMMVDQQLEFKDCFWGENGFEELKKYMRLGTDFCKELASILTERADQELNYSKGLNRASMRLQKLSKDFSGTLSDAWLKVAIQFDAEADMHKSLSTTLLEEIIKPLKILSDNQVKFRKPVELRVDKVYKNFQEKRSEDYKYRSRCFQLSKDIEKFMYNLDEAQKGVSGKPPNQKDIQKIESQIVKSKELLEKSELKYHKACSAVELARQDWQIEMIQSCCQMQAIESDRISALEQLIKKLSIQIGLLSRKVVKIADVYENIKINIADDIALACRKFGTTLGNEQELYLYDIYAENTKNMMNKDRRIYNLTKWNEWLTGDIQEQVKAKQGMEKLRNFAIENPKFSNSNNEADVEIKLKSVGLMQILFASSQYKVQGALSELLDQPKPTTQYTNMITTYDKQGVPTTVLKLESGPVLAAKSCGSTTTPNAPSPPHSPPAVSSRLHSAHRSSIVASISSTASSSSASASQMTTSMPMPTAAAAVPLVSMPVPVSLTYDNKTNTYHFDNTTNSTTINPNNNPTESLSTASTISSVSPAALSSSSSASSCSYSAALPTSNNTNNRSSLLLKAATTNKSTSRDKYLFKSSKKSSHHHGFDASSSESNPKPNQLTQGNQLIMDNYYNNSNNSVSDEDEDDDEWDEAPPPPPPAVPPVSSVVYLGECIVQYTFSATHSDELNLQPGDQISILEKREDGWWRGKLNNHDTVGLFPSTYVRELTNSATTTSSA